MKTVKFESQELLAGGKKDYYTVSEMPSLRARTIYINKNGLQELQMNRESAQHIIDALKYILGGEQK